MNRLLFFAAAAVALAAPARAQITYTHADAAASLERAGLTTGYTATTAAGLQALAEATGANRTWDFTALTFVVEPPAAVERVQAPAPGSDDATLAQATHILRATAEEHSSYVYHGLFPDRLEFYGIAALVDVGEGPQLALVRFPTPDRVYPLPLTAQSTWDELHQVEYEPSVPGLLIQEAEHNAVVGWGTLVTPAGQEAALMIRTDVVSSTSMNGILVGRDTTASIQFLTRGRIGAAIQLDGDDVATGGTYSAFTAATPMEAPAVPAAGLALEAPAPNPARAGGPVTLAFTLDRAATARLEVFDALGRRVATVAAGHFAEGRHEATWDAAGLPAGLYVARLSADGRTSTRRLTLAD